MRRGDQGKAAGWEAAGAEARQRHFECNTEAEALPNWGWMAAFGLQGPVQGVGVAVKLK